MFGFGKRMALTIVALLAFAGPLRAGEVSVAMLGDSLTAGYGLAPEEGLVPQLQDWLRAQGEEVRMINAGVSGDTTAGGRARLDWTLGDGVDALVVALGANDMLRGVPPEEARSNLTAIVEGAQARGLPVLLVGMESAANWGPEYKADFDAIFPDLAEHYGTLLMPSLLGPLSNGGSAAEALAYLQEDGLHPTPEGVALIVAELGPLVRELVTKAR